MSNKLIRTISNLGKSLSKEIETEFFSKKNSGKISELLKKYSVTKGNIKEFSQKIPETVIGIICGIKLLSVNNSIEQIILQNWIKKNRFLRSIINDLLIDFDGKIYPWVINIEREIDIYFSMIKQEELNNPAYFFEKVLLEYNKDEKQKKGIYYTPKPIVDFIIREVDLFIEKSLQLEDGICSEILWKDTGFSVAKHFKEKPFINILDPSVGSGIFLFELIGYLETKLKIRWKNKGLSDKNISGLWKNFVDRIILKQLTGYDISVSSLVLTDIILSFRLFLTGYSCTNNYDWQLYLKNSLDIDVYVKEFKYFGKNYRKKDTKENKFTVIITNPPYYSYSSNTSDKQKQLILSYREIKGKKLKERKDWLQDDYVKFMRIAHLEILNSKYGVIGVITNHSWIDNPTFRGMRSSFIEDFNFIKVLDLHGNYYKGEKQKNNKPDGNVFDIKQGVAISIIGKTPVENSRIEYGELIGTKELKLNSLKNLDNFIYERINPGAPYYFLIKQETKGREEYFRWRKINEIMPVSSTGIITGRDKFVIDEDKELLLERIDEFCNPEISHDIIRKRYGIKDNYAWSMEDTREKMFKQRSNLVSYVRKINYRPFDIRFIFYHPDLCWRMRTKVMGEIKDENIALITSRMTKGESFAHTYVTNHLTEVIFLSSKSSNNAFVFPLKIEDKINYSSTFMKFLDKKMNLKEEQYEKVFFYFLSILNSRAYRQRYSYFLKYDFPRIPFPKDIKLFNKLAKNGESISNIMLNNELDVSLNLSRKIELNFNSQPYWKENRIIINKEQETLPFKVKKDVWNYHIGGYRLCEKLLKKFKPEGVLKYSHLTKLKDLIDKIENLINITIEIDETILSYGEFLNLFLVE